MVVYPTFQFYLLLRPGKETNTVYSTKLISPETRFRYILFPTYAITSLYMAVQYTNMEIL